MIDLQLCESIARDFPTEPIPLDHWRNRARMHAQRLRCGDVFGDDEIVGGSPVCEDIRFDVKRSGTRGGVSDEYLSAAICGGEG